MPTSNPTMPVWVSGVGSAISISKETAKRIVSSVCHTSFAAPIFYLFDQGNMCVVSRVGDHHPPIKGQDADTVGRLETVIALVVVGDRRRNVCKGVIKSLVALLCPASFTLCGIFLDLGPQSFIGAPTIKGDITGDLGRQLKDRTHLTIAS